MHTLVIAEPRRSKSGLYALINYTRKCERWKSMACTAG